MRDRAQSRRFASRVTVSRDRGKEAAADRVAAGERPTGVVEVIQTPAPAALGLGAGQPLPPPDRRYFERRLGADLSAVRVHPEAPAAAALGAQAFASGRDIGFRPGAWQPHTEAGRHLLGHELTHVLQQGATGRAVQLQEVPPATAAPAPASAPNAPLASMPEPNAPVPPRPDRPPTPTWPVILFEGVQLAADAKFLRFQLEQIIAAQGLEATSSFAYRFINMSLEQSLAFTLAGSTAEQIAELKIYLKEEILHLEYDIGEFLKQFETQAVDVTRTLLDNSEKEIAKELQHYGITESTVVGTSVTVYATSNDNSGAGLRKNAAELAKKRREVNAAGNVAAAAQAKLSQATAGNPFRLGLESLEHQAESSRIDWLKKEDDYRDLSNARQKDYPILAAYTTGPDAVSHLEAVASMSPARLAREIGALADEKLANVRTVRGELGKRFSIWKAPNIITLTKKQMNATQAQSRAVADKSSQVQAADEDSKKLLMAVALGLGLLAAIPTGGASLALAAVATTAAVLGAGIAIYNTYEHLQDYNLQSAAAGSAFDKASAISQDDPSLLWLALDVVGAVVDIFAAAAAFKGLRAALELAKAKGVAELPALAQAARRAGLGAEAQGRLMAAAARGSVPAGGVEATLEAIRTVYRRLDPAGIDRDLAESFQVAADRLMGAGNVHILPRNANARWAAIKEAVGDNALAQQINRRFAKEQLLGLYDSSSGIDTVFLSEGGTAQDLAAVLAHEMTHQTQALRLDLEGMETFEAEFQALVAERAYMQLLAPRDVALLSRETRQIREARDLTELEALTRAINPKASWLLPRHVAAGRTGVLQAMADEIIAALRQR